MITAKGTPKSQARMYTIGKYLNTIKIKFDTKEGMNFERNSIGLFLNFTEGER